MPTYKYTALNNEGDPVDGILAGADDFEVMAKLKASYSVITSLSPIKEEEESSIASFSMGKKVSYKELSLLCSQFSIILTAGIPIVRCVELIAEQAENKTLKALLRKTAEDVTGGSSLAQAFENNGKYLPNTFIETIRAGEESGTLDKTFKSLSVYFDKSAKLKSKVISSLTYPAFLCVVAVVVVTIIMLVAVPIFSSTFADMNLELPLATRIVVGTSNFMTNNFLILTAILVVAVLGVINYLSKEKGKLFFGELQLKLPILGRAMVMKNSAQFASTLSTLVAAGLPLVKALDVTGKVLDNYMLGREIRSMVPEIEDGKSLFECMKKIKYLPTMLVEMTAIGEESGSLDSTLGIVSTYYDNEVDTSVARVVSLIEPIIVCVLAGFIVVILLAIYLPIFAMYGA